MEKVQTNGHLKTSQEFLTEFAKEIIHHPMERQATIVKYAKYLDDYKNPGEGVMSIAITISGQTHRKARDVYLEDPNGIADHAAQMVRDIVESIENEATNV